MAGLVTFAVALAVVVAVGLWLRRSPRRLASPRGGAGSTASAPVLGPSDLGAGLGDRATLVQFSTAFCQPCRATRVVLADVASRVPGVRHVEIDAESHLDLVRRLDVRRTPTVLVLDRAGSVVRRASGSPRRADVLAALAEAVR
jgi:thiol-disulfide isomerase/thioredoxin